MRPPELLAIEMVGNCYRWFYVAYKPLKVDVMSNVLNIDMKKTAWIDDVKVQILLCRKSLPKLIAWIEELET